MQQNQVNNSNNRIDAPIQNFPNRQFEKVKVLGQGGEGTVYLCKSINWGINDQKQFALKCQNESKPDEIQFIDNLIRYQNQYENQINKGQFNSQPSGLIRIYDRFKLNNQDFIVMEVGELDLFTYMQQQQNLSLEQKIKILIQLTQSIQYLHLNNLIHRDIKPENFIKVGDQFKLIDFGLTKQNSTIFKTTKVGTLLFQAPEILECKTDYNFSIDIWSLACVFYEILQGEALFNGQNENQIQQMILGFKQNSNFLNERLKIGNLHDTLKDLIKQMLKYNSAERIKLDKVMSILTQFSNTKNNNQPQQFNLQQKFPIQQENKFVIPQNFQTIGNANGQQNMISLQIQQLQEQFKDFNNKQTEKSISIENLLKLLLNQKDQLQDRLQNLEQKMDDCTSQIRKKESVEQGQQNLQQIQNDENQLKIKTNQEQENGSVIRDQIKEISRFMEQNFNELKQQQQQQQQQNKNIDQEQNQIKQQMIQISKYEQEIQQMSIKTKELQQIIQQQTHQLQQNEQNLNKQQVELQNYINQIKEYQIQIQNYDQKQRQLEINIGNNKLDQQRLQEFNQKYKELENTNRDLNQTIKQQESNIQELLKQQNNLISIQNNLQQSIQDQLKIKRTQEQENGSVIKDQYNKIQNLESTLSEIERKHNITIQQYQYQVNELEAKLQEYIIQDTKKKKIIVQTKYQVLEQEKEQDLESEYQKINSTNENSIFQTLEQEDNTSQQEHLKTENGLKLNDEQQDVNNKQFEQIKQQIQEILSKLQQALDPDSIKKQIKQKQQQNQNQKQMIDQTQELKNQLIKKIEQFVNKQQHKGQNQLNELKTFLFDQKKINFGKLSEIIQQFYSEIQPQSYINQETQQNQMIETKKNEQQQQNNNKKQNKNPSLKNNQKK